MMLERLDIRVKLVAFSAIVVAVFVFSHPLANALLLVGLVVLLLACRTPLAGLRVILRPLLPVFVLIVVAAMFTAGDLADPGHAAVLFGRGPLVATRGGLLIGLNLVARIGLMVLASHAFTVSTPTDDLLALLARFRAPYWLGILLTTALSLVPMLARRRMQIAQAQRARGARLPDKGLIGQVIGFVPLMVPLITNSILLADQLAVAMTNRGYGATGSMTPMRDLRMRGADRAVLMAVLCVTAAVGWLRFGVGYGVL